MRLNALTLGCLDELMRKPWVGYTLRELGIAFFIGIIIPIGYFAG